MTRKLSGQRGDPAPPALVDSETDALRDPASIHDGDLAPRWLRLPDNPDRTKDELARKRPRRRTWRGHRSSEQHKLRRLGPLEYMLLTLIILGVAVTIAVAIFNPSG